MGHGIQLLPRRIHRRQLPLAALGLQRTARLRRSLRHGARQHGDDHDRPCRGARGLSFGRRVRRYVQHDSHRHARSRGVEVLQAGVRFAQTEVLARRGARCRRIHLICRSGGHRDESELQLLPHAALRLRGAVHAYGAPTAIPCGRALHGHLSGSQRLEQRGTAQQRQDLWHHRRLCLEEGDVEPQLLWRPCASPHHHGVAQSV